MAQSVFRPTEINSKKGEVLLQFTRDFTPKVEEVVEDIPEYTGPTADDLRREAEAFKAHWEEEKAQMLEKAQADADLIVKNAEEAAFSQVKKQSDQAAIIKTSAEKEAQEIIEKARAEAQEIIAKAHEEEQEILDGTEQQIVNLVILIARKVVKIMSDNQKSVIMANVVQALKKVKGSGDVTLRVNLSDVKLTTEHIGEFIHQVENIKHISIVEDSSVEKGGCIVETDFGAIDARIASQLGELETQILSISPIKTVAKAEAINPDL